jgi:hypothetical protein
LEVGVTYCSDYAVGLTGRASNPSRGTTVCLFSKMFRPRLWPNQPLVQWVPASKNGRGVMLTTKFHLVPGLRMNGTIPLHPLYAYMAWRGRLSDMFARFMADSWIEGSRYLLYLR